MSYQFSIDDYFALAENYCNEGKIDGALSVLDKVFEITGMKVKYRCKSEYVQPGIIKIDGKEFPKCICSMYTNQKGRDASLCLIYDYIEPEEFEKIIQEKKEIVKEGARFISKMFGQTFTSREEDSVQEQIERYAEENRNQYLHGYRPHVHHATIFSGIGFRVGKDDLQLVPKSSQLEQIRELFCKDAKCDKMFEMFIDALPIPFIGSPSPLVILRTLYEDGMKNTLKKD